jgi:integrase
MEENWRMNYRYAVYQHSLIAPDGQVYRRPFIVVKNQYNVIIRFTKLHNYAGIFDGKVFAPMQSDATTKLHYICKMLNYILIEKFMVYGVDHVFNINREMLENFFRDYAEEPQSSGEYRGEASIENCVSIVTAFFRKLCRKFGGKMLLKDTELITEKLVYSKRAGMTAKAVPAFQIRGMGKKKPIFRELPTKMFRIFLNQAFRYTPDIAFAICLQAFAGLRAGEVCNVRQEQSPIGGGIILTCIGNDIRKAEIDLTREYPMRSDGVICGRIKKERVQCVYPPFLDAFTVAYKHHKIWLSAHSFEPDYCPMFVNNRGLAMTYDDYFNRFEMLIKKRFCPALLESGDPEARLYGQLLYEHKLGPHSLRHWFTVQLVLHGEDIAQIQYWRGDKSPESAFTYLQNKGELVKELEQAGDALIEMMLLLGEQEVGGTDGIY